MSIKGIHENGCEDKENHLEIILKNEKVIFEMNKVFDILLYAYKSCQLN